MSSIENQTTIEKHEVPKSTFMDDFLVPHGVSVPKGIQDGYLELGKEAQNRVHGQIEISLHDLEMKILKKNQEISLTLATVIHG